MADHGITMSLSHTSDDSSSDQPTPNTQGGGSGSVVGSSSYRRMTPCSATFQALALPQQKKPRGRPPGSKNKPKPPVVITQDSEQGLKPVVIEVCTGADIVEAVVSFARRRNVGISVLSGSGTIGSVTLRHPYSHAPALTLHGPFTLLSFTGSYISGPLSPSAPPAPTAAAGASASALALPPPPPSLVAPSLANANNSSACSSFAVSFSGSQGQIFGGVIAGSLVAATSVMVVASVFKKPEIHRVGAESGAGGDESGDDRDNSSQGGGDQAGGSDNMSVGFSVATPSTVMSCHPGDVNVMQWGNTLSSRTANY